MQETRRIDGSTVAVNCTGGCGESFRLPLTVEQEKSWRDGAIIQNVAPQIPPDDRELLISGTCGECWDALFANADEDMGFLELI